MFDASAPAKIPQVPIDVAGSKQPQVIAKTPEKGQKLNRKETIDEDPIVDDDIETATSSEHPSRQFVTTPIAHSREVKKPAPYVPTFGKGKGKAKVVGGNLSDFRRASSITVGVIPAQRPQLTSIVADSPRLFSILTANQ